MTLMKNFLSKPLQTNQRIGLILFTLISMLHAPQAAAQAVTTGGVSGSVVLSDGASPSPVDLILKHEPTGTESRIRTRENGTFSLRNLRPGGPYTLTIEAPGYQPLKQSGIWVEVDRNTELMLALRPETIVDLDTVVISGNTNDLLFSSNRTGIGSHLGGKEIERTPVGDRSLNSLLRLDPRIIYNRNPQDQAFSAGGASNRYNSIRIDGVSASDPFGLNSNNTAAARNVIPLDAVESISLDTSPFDLRAGGFTGASVNAVTKSGSNELSGSVYLLYRDQSMVRENLDGKIIPDFKEQTYGFTLGGPILRDRLFYFLSFEQVDEEKNPPSITNFPTAESMMRIQTQAQALGLETGEAQDTVSQKLSDENLLAKLDWQITDRQRLSFRYNQVESSYPNFPNYGGRNLSFDSHWYDQSTKNQSYITQWFSNWTDKLQSELSLSFSSYESAPLFKRESPQVAILNVPLEGTNQLGSVRFGTERSRHFNELKVDTLAFEAVANYALNDRHFIKAGYQLESSEVFNAFVQDFFGNYEFKDIAAFEAADQAGWAGTYRYNFRNGTQNPAAEFEEANHGLFIQDEYRPTHALTLIYGLRLDLPVFAKDVPANPTFEEAFGTPNNVTYDGNSVIQPRMGFNWKMDDAGKHQLRGGVGLFYGRMPRVWMSNAYSNTGLNYSTVSLSNAATPALNPNPEAQGPFAPASVAQTVVAIDPEFELPSSWKASLGYDVRAWGHTFSAETEHSWVHRDVLFTNLNRKTAAIGPDGRNWLGSSSNLVDTRFNRDTIFLTNTDKGFSRTVTLSMQREPAEDGWFWKAAYVNGYVREVQYGTSSVARSNWANRAILNQGEDVTSRGELEVAHRFLAVIQKDFEWIDGFNTRIGLVYDGHSGYPFSFRASNDVNGDGVNNNDLIYVPEKGDSRFQFATAEDETAFYQMVDAWDLKSGTHTRSGEGRYPFVNQFDLSLSQEIRIPGWKHKVILALDILNIGNLINQDWGLIKGSDSFFVKSEPAAQVDYDAATGTYRFSRVNSALAAKSFSPAGGRGEPAASRWSALLSVKYRF
jgi:hypothetical protein